MMISILERVQPIPDANGGIGILFEQGSSKEAIFKIVKMEY